MLLRCNPPQPFAKINAEVYVCLCLCISVWYVYVYTCTIYPLWALSVQALRDTFWNAFVCFVFCLRNYIYQLPVPVPRDPCFSLFLDNFSAFTLMYFRFQPSRAWITFAWQPCLASKHSCPRAERFVFSTSWYFAITITLMRCYS